MFKSLRPQSQRQVEVERLINLAKGLLDRNEEEIVVIYLDHAIEALHMAAEASRDF